MQNLFESSAAKFIGNVANAVCEEDLQAVVEGVRNGELWSLQMMDATTKIPNGILTGNLVDLGNYDECLQVAVPDNKFQGKHCMANIPFPIANTTTDSPMEISLALRWSYCLPSTCTAKDLQKALNSVFSVFNNSITVDESSCQVQQTNTFSGVDIFSISFFSFILFLTIASTIYDFLKKSNSNDLLRSFSLLTNGRKLLACNTTTDTMGALNGIRFLSMVWIILGHRYFFATQSPLINLLEMANWSMNVDAELILGGVLAVDTFFFMSGLLNAYHLLKLMDTTKTFPLATYYIHRYIRTTPALAAMVFIYTTWYIYIGDGPLWQNVAQANKQLCADNWWPTLLYINNYYNPVRQCAGQSWYLAVDMQLYWIAPLVILPCWKWPRLQKYLLTSLLVLSTAALFAVSYIDKIRMAFTFTQNPQEYEMITKDVYVPTHMRAPPYIMGIMLGVFLHKMKKQKNSLKLSKWEVMTGWIISTSLCLIVVFGNYPFVQTEAHHPYNRIESTFYISLHRIAWCCGIGWVIVACQYGYGGMVNDFLSWKVFTCLGRLTYCMFLTQLAVQQYQIGTMRISSYFSSFNQVYQFFGDLLTVIIASAILCLLFESPVIMIEKYFRNLKPKKREQNGARENEAYVHDPDDEPNK